MADPKDWGAVPTEETPQDWGAQPTAPDPLALPTGFRQYAAQQLEQAKHPGPGLMAGLMPGIGFLGGVAIATPEFAINGIADLLSKARKAYNEGLTQDEEVEFAVNAAPFGLGGGEEFRMPKTTKPSAFEDFHEQVTKPAAEAMVGVPSVEPPKQITIPLDPRNVGAAFPPPGMPRSDLAKTGEPYIDTVVNASKGTLDNPVVDRTQDVPNGVRSEKGITYIDRNLPRAVEADGKVFDPADPLIVRDGVTQRTVTVLRDGGMSEKTATRIAQTAGEKAETAWYAAHGIDRFNADTAIEPYLRGREAPEEELWPAYHGTAAEVAFEPHFDFSEGQGVEKGVGFFSSRPEAANVYSSTNARARARMDAALDEFVKVEKEMRDKYGYQYATKMSADDAKRYLDAREVMYRAQDVPEGAPGGRIIPVMIKPGKTETFDVSKLFAEDESFHKALRETSTDPDLGAPPIYRQYSVERRNELFDARLEEMRQRYQSHEETRQRILEETKDEEGGPRDIGPWKAPLDLIAPAVYLAKQKGLDTARIVNLGEHGEQIIVLNPANIKPRYAAHEITDAEGKRAQRIVAEIESEPVPAPRVNPLQEAHDLGVIGGPERPEMTPPPPVESPAVAAQRAIPANAKQGDKITMTPAGEPISAWEERFNDWLDRLQTPEDVKPFISDAAVRNNNFADARAGQVNPAHVEILADAAGLDPTKVDRGNFRTTFDTADKVRMAKEAMDQALNKFKEAAADVEKEPTAENIAKMLEAEIRRDYIIEQLLGLRAEWGRTGHALKDLLAAREGPKTGMISDELKEQLAREKTETPKSVKEVIDAVHDFTKNAATKEKGLGLDKLIAAAEKLVDETKPKEVKPGEPKAPEPKLDPDVKELVKTAQAVVNLMRPKEVPEPVTTVRPLRKIEGLGEKPPGPSPIADLNKLISEAERNVTQGVKEGKPVRQAMSKELADMVEAAENVTSHFGGSGLQRAITDLLARKGRTPEDMQMIARSMRGLTNEQAARVLTEMRGKQQAWYYWMWQQGLISGEVTHTKYVLTNLGFGLFDRVISPSIAAVISHIRGGEKTYFGEPIAGLWGLIRGVPDAFRGSVAAFRSGMRMPLAEEMQLADRATARGERLPRDLLHTQAIPYGQPGAPNWGVWQRVLNDEALSTATRTIGVSGRMASAIHTFFKMQNTRASLSARAYHEAAKEGLDPLSKEFEDRYNYHYNNPTDENLRGAVQDGYSGTFMDKLGSGEQWLASKVQASPVKWLFPFMHLPINIVRQSIKYSPMGWVTKAMRDDLTGRNGERAQNLAIAKMVAGSSILGYFIYRGMTGEATGDYPTDPNERREWQINGKIPNAVQFHGQWIQLNRFGPQGIQAALGADIGNIIRRYSGKTDQSFDEKMLNIIGHSTLGWLHSLANEAGFLTLQSLFELYEGRQSMAQWLGYQASTFVPFSSFLRQTASFMDPNTRQAKTLLDGLKMVIPGERQTLLPRRDPLYGEPVHNPGYHTFAPMIPVQPADPIKQELNRIGYFPTAPSNKIGGVKLTPEQFDRYEATAGPFVKKALTELMSSPQWKMHNNQPDWQKKVAETWISEARRKAAGATQADSMIREGPDNNLIALGRQRRLRQINGDAK